MLDKRVVHWIISLVILLGAVAPLAIAGPIIFTLTTTGTGTVGGAPFTNAAITITAVGDTSTVTQTLPQTWDIIPTETSVSITGVGTVNFTNPGYIFDNQDVGLAGFGTVTEDAAEPACEGGFPPGLPPGCDLLDISAAAFSTYALTTSIGPVVGGATNEYQWVDVSTSMGLMSLSSGALTGTFAANSTVAPEPPSYVFVFSGLALSNQLIRKRKRLRTAAY